MLNQVWVQYLGLAFMRDTTWACYLLIICYLPSAICPTVVGEDLDDDRAPLFVTVHVAESAVCACWGEFSRLDTEVDVEELET